MSLELTPEELELLKDILISMIEKTDWHSEGRFLATKILMEFDDNLPEKIEVIYDKLN